MTFWSDGFMDRDWSSTPSLPTLIQVNARSAQSAAAIRSAATRATAMIVPWGFTPRVPGSTDASATNSPSVSKTPNPGAARLRNLATHTFYGIGLFVSAAALAVVWI